VDAEIRPEVTEEERRVLLAALAEHEPEPYAGAWREAALAEGTETDEP
jgi:hypothetical protein